MAKVYSPGKYFFNGSKFVMVENLFYIFNITSSNIQIYCFEKINSLDGIIPSKYEVINSESFFNEPLLTKQNPIRAVITDISKPPYSSSIGKESVLKYTDIVDLNKFTLYNSVEFTDVDKDKLHLILRLAVVIPINVFSSLNPGPNEDLYVCIDDDNKQFYFKRQNLVAKTEFPAKEVYSQSTIMIINTGLKTIERNHLTEIDPSDYNIIISPYHKIFMSNITNMEGFDNFNNFRLMNFPNRLKLGITGPSSGSVGDNLEYTVTLMNSDCTEVISNPPTELEVYPIVDAGLCSHRKLVLKNGVGKFKVNTSDLYSGDVFDVKIGWKYITSDNSITVTLS
jgi:hypothetical protein